MSVMGPKAAMTALKPDFSFAPERGLEPDITACLKRANRRHFRNRQGLKDVATGAPRPQFEFGWNFS
jgi:hypothetical protein